MSAPVHLSAALLFKIIQHSSYYDTLRLGEINAETLAIVEDQELWKRKLRREKGRSLIKNSNIRDWHDFYILLTDRIGGELGLHFPGVVDSTLATPDVFWIVTARGLVYSLLRLDTTALWTQSEITKPVAFIRAQQRGYSVYAVTRDNDVYLLRAANRGAQLVLAGENVKQPISDLAVFGERIQLLLNNGTIVEVSAEGLISKGRAVVFLATPSGSIAITHIKQNKNHYIFANEKGDEYRVESGKERLAATMLSRPDKKLETKELPESAAEVDALDTYDIFAPFNRSIGAEYDREGQSDFVDEEIITGREILEGVDTG